MASIWSLPGLEEDEFYAAAYFLSVIQRQQKEQTFTREYNQKHSESQYTGCHKDASPLLQKNAQQVNSFLDRLALLYARLKNNNQQQSRNVTATGLLEDLKKPKEWTFWITKNHGLDPNDMKSEHEICRKSIVEWLAKSTSASPLDQDPGPENEAWEYLEIFWLSRIKHYVDTICKALSKLEELKYSADSDSWTAEAQDLGNVIARSYTRVEPKKRTEPTRIKLPLEIFDRCYAFRGRKVSEEKPQTPKALPVQLAKLINAIEMLGMMKSMWNSLVDLRAVVLEEKITVDIRLCKSPPSEYLLKKDLQCTITNWVGTNVFIVEKDDILVEELAKLTSDGFEKYFHCELQMTEYFNSLARSSNTIRPHPYIGVSKLSCYLCGAILEQETSPYKTRGTHFQISANCHFPFTIDDVEPGLGFLVDGLLIAQDRFLGRINAAARGSRNKWTKNEEKLQTNPGISHRLLTDGSDEAKDEWPTSKNVLRFPDQSIPFRVLRGSLQKAEKQGTGFQVQEMYFDRSEENDWILEGSTLRLEYVTSKNFVFLPGFATSTLPEGLWYSFKLDHNFQEATTKRFPAIVALLWICLSTEESRIGEVEDYIYVTAMDGGEAVTGMPWRDMSIQDANELLPILTSLATDIEFRNNILKQVLGKEGSDGISQK